jgi:hypothetical protein
MEEILDDIVVVSEMEAWSVVWFLVVLALWQASYRQSTGHNKNGGSNGKNHYWF